MTNTVFAALSLVAVLGMSAVDAKAQVLYLVSPVGLRTTVGGAVPIGRYQR